MFIEACLMGTLPVKICLSQITVIAPSPAFPSDSLSKCVACLLQPIPSPHRKPRTGVSANPSHNKSNTPSPRPYNPMD